MTPIPSSVADLLIQNVVDYAIYMLDLNGRVVSWNPGAQRIKGYEAREIIGESFAQFYTQDDRALGTPAQALKTAAETGRFTAEAWRVRKDGSRFWAMVVIDPIYESGKLVGFAKVTRDLTERRDAQLRLEEAREQLAQSQKMEAIGQLTGGLAHDFNNLLTGVIGSLDLLKTRLTQGRLGDLERYLAAAQGAATRAASLTHRLLAFARRQTLDPKSINADSLIAEVEELVRRTVGPTIKVETVRTADLWRTRCDPHQLENALLNLCINGRDAMPEGGRLVLKTANAQLDDAAARYEVEAGDYVSIAVSDTGCGMPPDVLARAFDPFFTTKPLGQGTGLGLSMVYGFARQSGGFVQIQSQQGHGTTVRLYLPRHDGPAEEESGAAAASILVPAPKGETVLVVDDEPTVRMLATDVLKELGYAVIEAADSCSGLKVLESDVQIDLLITDIGLPGGLNGRQMADAARKRRPRMKVLFITGYAEGAALGNGNLAPDMHMLAKPFSVDSFVGKIKSIIAE